MVEFTTAITFFMGYILSQCPEFDPLTKEDNTFESLEYGTDMSCLSGVSGVATPWSTISSTKRWHFTNRINVLFWLLRHLVLFLL